MTDRGSPLDVVRALVRHDVRFVVTGDVAARLWGSPRLVEATEVVYARDRGNLERLVGALRELLDAEALVDGAELCLPTRAGPVVATGRPAGGSEYEALAVNASALPVADDLVVPVADLEDLIRLRRGAGGADAPAEVELLAAVLEERDRPRR
jgi:hypothetical protein